MTRKKLPELREAVGLRRGKVIRTWVGAGWLRKWRFAEERVKKAKSNLRSIKARIAIQRNRYGLPATRAQLHNRTAAEEELRVAKAAELKFMSAFAHVQRWAIEEGWKDQP